jgi:hypothetical protein
MMSGFDESLSRLKALIVKVSAGNGFPEQGQASIALTFTNGTTLQAEYWRLIIDGHAAFSSFDHRQQYGLPAPIDAIRQLEDKLEGKVVTDVHLETETGDLVFQFLGNLKLQILNFTGYEIWVMSFPNGSVEYSNHNK